MMDSSPDFSTLRAKKLLIFIAMIAAINGLLFGFDTGVISGAILFINKQFSLSVTAESFVMISLLVGACLGAVLSGHLSDVIGRRKMLFIDAALYVVGTLVAALSTNIFLLIFGRIIIGFAIGISSFVAPLYVSELAFFKNRGQLVAMFQLFITLGILISYVFDYFFSFGSHWRWMFSMGVFPAVILYVSLFFLPESPRWLASVGQYDKAKEALERVRDTINVDREFAEIKDAASELRGDIRMLFKPWLFPAVIVGFGVAVFQQLVGINTIVYFVPTVLENVGFPQATSALLATIGVGIVLVFFSIFPLYLLDKWGRRPLMILGLSGMSFSFFLLSILIYISKNNSLANSKWLFLFSIMLYIASFAISLGPIGWLIISEIFPLRVRGLASSLAAATIWGFNVLVTGTFLPLVNSITFGGTFLLYCILCIIGLTFAYYFMPETKDVSLEHIENNLRLGKRCRELGLK